MRKFSGKDAEVAAFAGAAESLVRQTVRAFQQDGRQHIQVAFGCTGGQHRSVFMAEELGRRLQGMPGVETEIIHTAEAYWKRQPPL